MYQRQEKIIRSTDLDALSCRWNCVEKGYLKDDNVSKIITSYSKYLQFCEGYSSISGSRAHRSILDKKLPIINRGTYLRTQSITNVLKKFISEFPHCQIVSMGGGSDTRVFQLLNPNIKYIEIDFPETVKVKKLTIINDQKLCETVGLPFNPQEITDKLQFETFSPNLHTNNYHLIGLDLRNLCNANDDDIAPYVDVNLPTLVLSECVLCYLNPEENELIVKYWKTKFNQLSVLIYEPISLNDSFGVQMVENLGRRGINLLTINEFPTLESKLQFMNKLGFSHTKVTDIASIGGYKKATNWFSEQEQQRINRLELIDEIEEIVLLLSHYCLVYSSSMDIDLGFNWVLS